MESQGKRLSGYASVFDQFTTITTPSGRFREVVRPGAFTAAVQGDIRMLWSHDDSAILGRTKSGTLKLAEDAHGLRFDLELPDSTLGRDVAELVRRGDIDGCSFGWITEEDEWHPGDVPTRELKRVDLVEVSIVAWPAYPQTSVDVRSKQIVSPPSYQAELMLLDLLGRMY